MKKITFILLLSTAFLFSYGKSYLQSFQVDGIKTFEHSDIKSKVAVLLKKYSDCRTVRNRDKNDKSKIAVMCTVRNKTILRKFNGELRRKIPKNGTKGKLVIKRL